MVTFEENSAVPLKHWDPSQDPESTHSTHTYDQVSVQIGPWKRLPRKTNNNKKGQLEEHTVTFFFFPLHTELPI